MSRECRIAYPCQISWRSVKPLPRYRDFWIFQDGGCRHLGFITYKIFNSRNGQEGRTASSCQISSISLKPRSRYGDFSIFFKLAAVRYLGFVMRVSGPPTKGIWWSLSLSKIWLESMQYSFDNMHVFRFLKFGSKTPIHAQKLGV